MMATLRKEYAAAKAAKFESEAAADAAARSAAAKAVSRRRDKQIVGAVFEV